MVEQIKQIIGLDCLLVGFGLDDDRVQPEREVRCGLLRARHQGNHIRMLAALAEEPDPRPRGS